LPSTGFYSHLAVAGAAVSFGLVLFAMFLPDTDWLIFGPGKRAAIIDFTALHLICVTWLLSFSAIFATVLMYEDHPEYRFFLRAFTAFGFVLSIAISVLFIRSLLYPVFERESWLRYVLLLSVVLAALGARAMVLKISPDPVIDVYAWLRDASDHALHGRNPYSHDITSPYGTERARHYGLQEKPDPRPPAYPPLPFLSCLPFRALGLDVRWANIVGDLAAGIALFGVGVRRGRPSFGLLCACLVLNLPRSAWMIEQAWYEPILAGLFGAAFWLIEYEGWRRWFGYMLLALGLTGKQFGLPLLFPLAWSQRRHWRMLLAGLIVAGLVMLPWIVWSPHDFFDVILWKHLDRKPQFSLTVASACEEFLGTAPPKKLLWAVAAGLILAISWRTPQPGAAAALGVGTALFVFCIFHTQGFPNYFYLCEYLWLLGMIGLLPENKAQGRQSLAIPFTGAP
jgi:hypothetical protein